MTVENQSPAEPTPGPGLLALARKNFGALSRAEEELFRAAQEGRQASALTGDKEEDNPVDAANWNAERVVRARCISWVCTDPHASALMTYHGLELVGMRIDGELDLDHAVIKFSLRAGRCAFSGNISLRDAQLRGFCLIDCQIKSLNAGRAKVDGPLFMRAGHKAQGAVDLRAIEIGGALDCSGGQFLNADGFALIANGAKIEGGVFLRDGFRAEGEVNLVATAIGGDLDCSGAQFSNVKGLALTAGSAKIQGNAFLRGFRAGGEVNLRATISGDLDCSGAQFSNANHLALDVEGSKIGGNAFLRNGFQAHGVVNLTAATIGNLQILDVLAAEQTVFDLRLAKVGTLLDDVGSWPKAGNLLIDGFRYERLDEAAPFRADSRGKWLNLQPRDRFRPQPYEQLAVVLRQMGHNGEAKQVMIEKNRERARFTHFPHQSWWWYNLFGKLIGYGYRPWRACAMSLAMILLGTFLFYLGSVHALISPTSENAYAKAPSGQVILAPSGQPGISEKYPVFNAFVYSLESFIPLLKLDQSASWTPNANRSAEISSFHLKVPFSGTFLRYYLYFHIAAGWLLTSLWVGAITGLVKT